MNNFQKSEEIGRRYTKEVFDKDYHIFYYKFSDDKYSAFDAELLSGGCDVQVEIKYRRTYKFNCNEGYMYKEGNNKQYYTIILEKSKIDGMKKTANNNILYYYVLFANGVGFKFNLSDIDLGDIHQDYCPKSSDGDNSRILKDTYHLPFYKGTMFTFNI